MIYPINSIFTNSSQYKRISQTPNTKITFGEIDDSGNYKYPYYSPQNYELKNSKECKKAKIEAEYIKKFSDLCKVADEIDMDNATFWELEKKLSEEKANELEYFND